MRLSGKKIILGITGSIAAYKSASLCRLLVSEGAEVRVVMTPSATDFITPLTLSVLSKNQVMTSLIGSDHTWNNHVETGMWADLMVVAPASAETISAFVTGRCENALQAVYLSARCPVMVAPAMDHDMYLHPATQTNLRLLEERGTDIIYPAKGELASGLSGEGRMQEPETILDGIISFFSVKEKLKGRKILLTAGPTREAIDPVRYITNHSSGKMGIALAKALRASGAEITLVAGPLSVQVPGGIKHIPVVSASEMYEACIAEFPSHDAAIMSAAVADYTPSIVEGSKIKKKPDTWELNLTRTRDILASLGSLKRKDQVLVGFALETNDELENARTKLEKKNLDLIVLNSLRDEGAGFGTDTNKVTLLYKGNKSNALPLMPKDKVAFEIINALTGLLNA